LVAVSTTLPDHGEPAPLRSGGDVALAVGLLGLAGLLGALDLALGLAGWFAGGGFRLRSLDDTMQLLLATRIGSSRAGRGAPGIEHPALVGALLVILLGAGALVASGIRRRWKRQTSEPRDEGFASRQILERSASFTAASARAPQTRPSLVGTIEQPADVGYALGRSLRPRGVDLVASFEASLQLVAPPGSGKTLRVLARMLRAHPGPALATSTKPDLFEVTALARERVGPVVTLDPEGLAPAAEPVRWSPVVGCTDTAVAERRAAALIAANGEVGDLRSGAFFKHSATVVLAAYLHAAALSGGSMHDVVQWASRPSDPAPLRVLAEGPDTAASWAARLSEHTTGAVETTSGVMRSVDLALGCFHHRAVLDLCSPAPEDAIDLRAILEENGSVFALGKDRGVGAIGVAPLVTAFSEELLLTAEQLATEQATRRLDPPLLALLDEAPSIAPLPGLPGLVADGRGRGITVAIAMQSFSQAVERWGRTGAATIRNAATITAVLGGLGVAEDLEELSRLCGTRKVRRHSATEDTIRGRSSVGISIVDEAVLTPADIRELPDGVALLLWGSLAPVLTRLPGTWEGPDAEAIAADERAARERNDRARRAARR
jgi:hypothetical protein